ncbi:Carbohydrate binding family 6 [Ruminiclostridium papyrosolvens DSM 2782]|uniref:cellulase n=1 Tax=Ruminiclostridium papyrosolvens DSM 2782 TaxID=588581 RepID=F1T8Q5_9FIRM|nr:carbohydrate-binding protein [Ruminiclostridium papyrosolvens]EGD48887.1 Carbohydrate binding family 6 [Ruminiclostridium papyrosolvens DSM 2782]WES35371.1 carbohydrate-binding protein [Ruminiclostridium papyrosolvens DSM 2782]
MKLNYKKILNVFLVSLIVFSMVFTVQVTEVSAASDVTVNLSAEKQEMRGFGGMVHTGWQSDLTAAQRETAFGNGNGQLGFSILRIHVDENSSNWSKEVATAKSAIAHGGIVFASPWNPPTSMQEKFTRNGTANQTRLKYDQYSAYAQHLNNFVKYMKDNGAPLYAISVQNEPDYAHTWTWWTPQEMLNFMKNNAGSITGAKVIAPESFQYLKNMSDPILNDSTALANMDILGAHFYGTSVSNMPYSLFQQKGAGKELWMTEVYVPNSDADSADRFPEALDVAYNMHNGIVEGNFQAYVWWYIRRSYGPMKEDGTMSKRGAMMAQYSKFVRPGYVRVDATKNPNTNVFVSAYKGDGKAVVVAINKSSSAVSQKINLQGASSVSKISSWVTDGSKNVAAATSYTGTSFTAQLPAQSVTTFVADLGTITPVEKDAFSQLEGEAYDDQSGTQNGSSNEGGECLGYIENGDYAVYKNVNFGEGAQSFQARVSSATSGGNIEIRLDSIDGTLVGTCPVKGTGDWQTWADVTCNVSGVTGKHDLYLKFTGDSGYLFNINWFKFSKASVVTEKIGDINNDGQIDALDLMALKKFILGLDTIENTKLADLDANGEVNAIDFALLKQYIMGLITDFPTK